jgi:hypothetical protein
MIHVRFHGRGGLEWEGFRVLTEKGQKLPVAYWGKAAFSRDFRSRTLPCSAPKEGVRQ